MELMDVYGGASLLQNKGMVIRLLGHSSQDFTKDYENMLGLFSPRTFPLAST